MVSLIHLLWIQVVVCVHAYGSAPVYALCAYQMFPCSYGICHFVAAIRPMVEEVIFPADFHADRFDLVLRQLATALSISCIGS